MNIKKPIQNVMIFGDSYSTFEGYIPEGYAFYYKNDEKPGTDVRHVEETWWYGLFAEIGANLVQNNSWSGSTIGNTGYDGDCSKTSSFICRLETLKENGFFEKNEIDTVFVFGGTNDSWSNAPLGEIKLSDHTKEDLFFVCPAICYFIGRLKEILPSANIVSIINTNLKAEIGDTIKAASDHNGTAYVELSGIDKLTGHPTIKGMAEIKEQVKAALMA